MEIDRNSLIKLLEAFVDTAEVLQRELLLYQMLFASTCKSQGLTDEEAQRAADRVRAASAAKIDAACRKDYLDLQGRLPQIVDLLASNQDEALQYLKKWSPKGLPN